jgi:DNA-binding MarR family transcriptional regulator
MRYICTVTIRSRIRMRSPRPRRGPTEANYRRLADFRYALRRFIRFSEEAARRAGISPSQYQLLLFVRGFPDGPPTIAELAERLQVAHHSAVGLVDRSVRAGLAERRHDDADGRRVRVGLTPRGRFVLMRLVRAHSPEVDRLAAALFRGRVS